MQNPASPQEIVMSKIQSFIKASKKSTDKQTTEGLSRELTSYIKQSWFFPLAHKLLTKSQSFASDRRDKEILISSFVKDKFKFEFESLNIANVEVHYKQLCEIAFALRNSSYAAYTNIALALAYTYLHLLALQLTPIESYISILIPDQTENIRLFNIYFKTLEYIATEIDNNKFVMDELQRQTARQRLNAQQINVLQLLNNNGVPAFQNAEINHENILNSFQAWITLHYEANVLNNIPQHNLFKKILQHINDEDCGEAAGNCLRSIIYQLKGFQQNTIVYQTLSNCTMQILSLVQNSHKNLQIDKAEDFIRIIADFSRKSIDLFIKNYDKNIENYFKKLIHYLRDDFMNTYETLADFFEDYLKALNQAKTQNQTLNPSIFQIIDPLYNALTYKCEIPNRIMKELNITEESKAHHISTAAEQLIRNRQYTETIFVTIGELQGKENYIRMVVEKILALSTEDQKHFWSSIEIYLYSLIDVIREYPNPDQLLATIVNMYSQLSTKGPVLICVRRTFLRVFRSILYMKTKQVDLVYRIMCIAVSCFEQPLLMPVAQKTFCRACEQNKQTAVSIFGEFAPVIEKFPSRQYIVKGLITVLCCQGQLINQYFNQILTFLLKNYREEPEKAKRKEYLHSITSAIKVFKDSPLSAQYMNVLLQFTRDIWPYVKSVLAKPQQPKDDEDSDVQRMVRIVKAIMRSLQFHFSQFLEDLFTIVLTAFQTYPLCSYVYLVEIAVTVYAKNPAYNDYLRRLYSSFCDLAFHHMQNIQDLGRFSYLMDDFMGMNKRFFLHNASVILSSGKLPSIITLAINAFMGCDIPRVAKAAYSFFQTIFIVYWPAQFLQKRNSDQDITPFVPKAEDVQNYQALKAYLLQNLQQIVSKMLMHLSNAPTEQTRDYILDALVSEIKGFIPQNPVLWSKLLLQIRSEILVQKQKERMVQLLKSLQGANFESAQGIVKTLDRMLVLMNQRLLNADKRKNISF